MTATSKAALNFSPYSEPPDHSRISVGKSQPNLTANTSAPEAGPSSSSSYQAGGAVEALGGNAFGSEGQGDHTRADSFGSGFSSAVQPGDYDTR